MLNQVIFVGRIENKGILEEIENGKKVITITLKVPRSFKNEEGNYDNDFIDCKIFNSVAENTNEYCEKGDLVGIKGRMQSRKIEDTNVLEVIAEKITYLKSGKEDNNE